MHLYRPLDEEDVLNYCIVQHKLKFDLQVLKPNRYCVIYWYKLNLHIRVRVMVLNATFNNISVMSWESVLLVEETGVPGEFSYHNAVLYSIFNSKFCLL